MSTPIFVSQRTRWLPFIVWNPIVLALVAGSTRANDIFHAVIAAARQWEGVIGVIFAVKLAAAPIAAPALSFILCSYLPSGVMTISGIFVGAAAVSLCASLIRVRLTPSPCTPFKPFRITPIVGFCVAFGAFGMTTVIVANNFPSPFGMTAIPINRLFNVFVTITPVVLLSISPIVIGVLCTYTGNMSDITGFAQTGKSVSPIFVPMEINRRGGELSLAIGTGFEKAQLSHVSPIRWRTLGRQQELDERLFHRGLIGEFVLKQPHFDYIQLWQGLKNGFLRGFNSPIHEFGRIGMLHINGDRVIEDETTDDVPRKASNGSHDKSPKKQNATLVLVYRLVEGTAKLQYKRGALQVNEKCFAIVPSTKNSVRGF